MRHALRVLLLATLALGLAPAAQAGDPVVAAMRAAPHVILVRHAQTAGGAGDPPGFRLEDCATQRPLTPAGRAAAALIGGGCASQTLRSARCCRRSGAAVATPRP